MYPRHGMVQGKAWHIVTDKFELIGRITTLTDLHQLSSHITTSCLYNVEIVL